MSKRKDLTGQQFGRWTVLSLDEEKTKEKKHSYWICQCKCGNVKTVDGNSLTAGRTQSCGCLQREKTSIDITGQRFGKLVALYKTDSHYDKNNIARTYWHCKCDCGNECDVPTNSLRHGDTQSCGCLYKQYQEGRTKDLTHQRFGKLFVMEKDIELSQQQGRTYWRCQCDCGNIKSIYHTCLTSGDTSSCGCIKSKGENDIELILKENDIQYVKEYWFKDLFGEGGAHLRYDFAIIINNKICGLIEYNGIQHYKPIEYWGGQQQLEKQQRQDELKEKYCKENNIPFIVFTYQEDNVTIEGRLNKWLKDTAIQTE